MISIGGVTGFLIIALLYSADVGETERDSLNEPDVPFPPAAPTAQNLDAICNLGEGRPRYPASFFPDSGFSHWKRRGNAINRLEGWYSWCCREQTAEQLLCCAQQAWKQTLSQFCVEEYSTMTNAYVCCADKGDARWTCFDSELPNPNYEPTPDYTAPPVPEETGFTFNTTAC